MSDISVMSAQCARYCYYLLLPFLFLLVVLSIPLVPLEIAPLDSSKALGGAGSYAKQPEASAFEGSIPQLCLIPEKKN